MSELFEFEVAYSTTNKQIKDLQEKMKQFVLKKNRDFLPEVFIAVQGMRIRGCGNINPEFMYASRHPGARQFGARG